MNNNFNKTVALALSVLILNNYLSIKAINTTQPNKYDTQTKNIAKKCGYVVIVLALIGSAIFVGKKVYNAIYEGYAKKLIKKKILVADCSKEQLINSLPELFITFYTLLNKMDHIVLNDRNCKIRDKANNGISIAVGIDVFKTVNYEINKAEDTIIKPYIDKAYEDNITDEENAVIKITGIIDRKFRTPMYCKRLPFAVMSEAREKITNEIIANSWKKDGTAYNLVINRNHKYFFDLVTFLIEQINILEPIVKNIK